MLDTDKEQIIEYLKVVGFEQTTDRCEGTTGKIHYKLEDDEILIKDVIFNEEDFSKTITTKIKGYVGIMTYLKIYFKIV